ncbi:MAG: gfo/Idh/MocA family oxidoreductase [Salinarimonadaceae bacterium]|nr:MAG: gfo/Idh/MocA family oxidoreductase [Salinarimonadaceae bacterium]
MSAKANPPRVAVIGCGAWGRNIVRCFANLGALEAIADNNGGNVAPLVDAHGCRVLDADGVIADPAIEAIAIATPPSSHMDLALRAIAAGKHVLIEKPTTLDYGQTVRIVEAARAAGRVMMTGHILQFHPGYLKLREIVRSGALGAVRRINANRLNLGAVRREESALWCLAPHDVSMALGLVDGAPISVEAFGEGLLRPDIADAVTMRLRFPKGEQAMIHVSWLHPYKEHRLSVIGSTAMAVFDDVQPWETKVQLYPHRVSLDGDAPQVTRGEPVPVAIEPGEPLLAECAHFLERIRDGAEPATGPIESLAVMDVLTRAERAMNLGTEHLSAAQ